MAFRAGLPSSRPSLRLQTCSRLKEPSSAAPTGNRWSTSSRVLVLATRAPARRPAATRLPNRAGLKRPPPSGDSRECVNHRARCSASAAPLQDEIAAPLLGGRYDRFIGVVGLLGDAVAGHTGLLCRPRDCREVLLGMGHRVLFKLRLGVGHHLRSASEEMERRYDVESRDVGVDALGEPDAALHRNFGQSGAIGWQQNVLEHGPLLAASPTRVWTGAAKPKRVRRARTELAFGVPIAPSRRPTLPAKIGYRPPVETARSEGGGTAWLVESKVPRADHSGAGDPGLT